MSSISINFNTGYEFQFDMSIDGMDDHTPDVHFIISGATAGYEVSINCEQVDDNTWVVAIPKLPIKKGCSPEFRVEVVIDGYHFVPVTGTIKPVVGPSISIKSDTFKPIKPAKESRAPKKPSPPPVKESVEFDVSELDVEDELQAPDGGVEYMEPSNSSDEALSDDEVVDDEALSDDELESELDADVPPSEYYSSATDNNSVVEDAPVVEQFDAKSTAQRAIQSIFGGFIPVAGDRGGSGSVLKRDAKGRLIGEGIESAEVTREREERSRQVRSILSN